MTKRLSAREIRVLFVAIVAVEAAVVWFFLYLPLSDRKLSLEQSVARVRKAMEGESEMITRAQKISARAQAYQGRFTLQGAREEAVASILKELEATLRELSMEVTDLKPGQVKAENGFYEFSVGLSLHSDLSGLSRFLYVLQQEPYLFAVDEFHIERPSSGNDVRLHVKTQLRKLFILSTAGERHVEDEAVTTKEARLEGVWKKEDMPFNQAQPLDVYWDGIARKDLFRDAEIPMSAANDLLPESAAAMEQRIKLIGILVDGDPKAVVEDLRENQTHFLSRGESISAITLEEITADKVIFVYNDQRYEMSL